MRITTEIIATHATRRLRRVGLEYRVTPAMVIIGLPLAAATLSAAALSGSAMVAAAWGSDSATIVTIVALVLVLIVVRSPARSVRSALAATRSWWPLAHAGVTVRQYLFARRFTPEATKALFVLLCLTMMLVGLASHHAVTPPAAVTAIALVASCAVAALGIDAFRLVHAMTDRTRTLEAVAAAVLATAIIIGIAADISVRAMRTGSPLTAISLALSDSTVVHVLALTAITETAIFLAMAVRRLRAVTWPAVTRRFALTRRRLWVTERPLPATAARALLMIDTRRLFRSATERLRPVGALAALLLVVALGLLLTSWAGGTISLPLSIPRREGTAAALGLLVFLLSIPTAALFAMDADRRALLLWLSVPGTLRRVAQVRAATSTLLLLLAATPAAIALIVAFDAGDAKTLFALSATGAVAAIASSVCTIVPSLLWPHLTWAETTDIGAVGTWRLLTSSLAPVPIIATAALAPHAPLTAPLALALAIAMIAAAAPIAALAMTPVSRRWILAPVT